MWCEPALPILTRIAADYSLGSVTRGVALAVDALTLTEVPVTGAIRLTITGNVFFSPVRVWVAGRVCQSAMLMDPDNPNPLAPLPQACYYAALNRDKSQLQYLCTDYARSIQCDVPDVQGHAMVVTVSSGLIGEVTEEPDEAEEQEELPTMTSMAPRVSAVRQLEAAGHPLCTQSSGQPLSLLSCPVTQPFFIEVCAAWISVSAAPVGVLVLLDLGGGDDGSEVLLPCGQWYAGSLTSNPCINCTVHPRLTPITRLVVMNSVTSMGSEQPAMITFQQCPAGYRSDFEAATTGNSTNVCAACPPGSSTDGVQGASYCSPCPGGFFSVDNGTAKCQACPAGTFAPSPNHTACLNCSLNSFVNATSQTVCDSCELDEYIVLRPQTSSAGSAGACHSCPVLASCDANGSISAHSGAYLLIDQESGTVSTTLCSYIACWEGTACSASDLTPPVIASSHLPVINCCGDGRWPAYAVGQLPETRGHNVLCARCVFRATPL